MLSLAFSCGKKVEQNKPSSNGKQTEELKTFVPNEFVSKQSLSCLDPQNCPDHILKVVSTFPSKINYCTGVYLEVEKGVLVPQSCLFLEIPDKLKNKEVRCLDYFFAFQFSSEKQDSKLLTCKSWSYFDQEKELILIKLRDKIKTQSQVKLSVDSVIQSENLKVFKIQQVDDYKSQLYIENCWVQKNNYIRPLSDQEADVPVANCNLEEGEKGAMAFSALEPGVLKLILYKNVDEQLMKDLRFSQLLPESPFKFAIGYDLSCLSSDRLCSRIDSSSLKSQRIKLMHQLRDDIFNGIRRQVFEEMESDPYFYWMTEFKELNFIYHYQSFTYPLSFKRVGLWLHGRPFRYLSTYKTWHQFPYDFPIYDIQIKLDELLNPQVFVTPLNHQTKVDIHPRAMARNLRSGAANIDEVRFQTFFGGGFTNQRIPLTTD
jgi:hypothetical protein